MSTFVVPGAASQAKTKGATKVFKPLSPDHFETVERMVAPDWPQKCFVLLCPISEQHLLCLIIFVRFVHQGCACKHKSTFFSTFNFIYTLSLIYLQVRWN